MHIKTDLSQALKLSIIPSKPMLAILAGIKITADKDIKLATTDLEISKVVTCTGTIKKKGSCVVNGKMLLDIFKTISTADLELKESELVITSESSSFRLPTMDIKEFPDFPEFKSEEKLEIDGDMLTEAITKTIKAVGKDASRPVLTGAKLTIGKDFTLVATDSYRLAKYSQKINSKVKIEALIPLASLEEILKLIDGVVVISCDKNLIKIQTAQTIFLTRVLDGQFPNYKDIIPKENKSTITCDKDDLTNAIKQAELMAGQNNAITIEGSLEIRAATKQIGESKVKVKADGKMEATSFNAQYLLDGLSCIDSVKMGYNGPVNPCVFQDNNYLYMIMPVRTV